MNSFFEKKLDLKNSKTVVLGLDKPHLGEKNVVLGIEKPLFGPVIRHKFFSKKLVIEG